MTAWSVGEAARVLLDSERSRVARAPLTDEWPDLSIAEAYEVQDLGVRLRSAAGDPVTGVKVGLTSKAKQARMNVNVPVTAWLTLSMALSEGEPLDLARFIHPRVEPEIVFVMGERLQGPGVTAEYAMKHVAAVRAGAEVIDSRYADFRFTLPDVVADNASSAAYYIGSATVTPAGIDLVNEPVTVSVDGEKVDTATGAAVLGHPGEALALAANELAVRGLAIEAQWIVLTGGMTDAVALSPGRQVEMVWGASLGSITVTAV